MRMFMLRAADGVDAASGVPSLLVVDFSLCTKSSIHFLKSPSSWSFLLSWHLLSTLITSSKMLMFEGDVPLVVQSSITRLHDLVNDGLTAKCAEKLSLRQISDYAPTKHE